MPVLTFVILGLWIFGGFYTGEYHVISAAITSWISAVFATAQVFSDKSEINS
jgi:hypothetical protein